MVTKYDTPLPSRTMVSWAWPSWAETLVISRRLPAGTVGNVNWHWPPGHVAESATTAVAWYGSSDVLMSQKATPR